jgi:hypothetical protein
MLEHINVGIIVAQVELERAAFKGTLLLVEGETDSRFWKKFVAREQCSLVVAHGKKNVEGAISKLEEGGRNGILGVVDADWDRILGRMGQAKNLIVTETHDLETLILASSALDFALGEYDPAGRLSSLLPADQPVIDGLVRRGLAFGLLRLANQLEAEPQSMAWLRIPRFFDDKWRLNAEELEEQAIENRFDPRTYPLSLDPDSTWQLRWQICHGKDLLEILVLGLKAAGQFGGRSSDDLGIALRLAFSVSSLARTEIYRAIRAWEEGNPDFIVLLPLPEVT